MSQDIHEIRPRIDFRDSRYAARRLISKFRWQFRTNLAFFFGSFVTALALTYFLVEPEFTDSAIYTIFILFFALGLWLTEAIPPFAVGLMIMGYLVYTMGSPFFNSIPEDVSKYTDTWSSSIIWLMLSGFFIAAGMEKTGLDFRLFKFSTSLAGTRPKNVLLAFMLTSMVSSMIMSNTATTAMMIATIAPLLNRTDQDPKFLKALLLGIPSAAAVGGMGTIIGSPPNAIAVGALENVGIHVNFLTWMAYGVPLALILTLVFWWALTKKFPTQGDLDLGFILQGEPPRDKPRRKRIIVQITLALTVGLWLTGPVHNIPVSTVAAIPIVFLTVSGVLKANDMRSLPWDTLMLVAGGLSLGVALIETGIASHYMSMIEISVIPYFIVLLIFAYITMSFSNVMSNTAATSILIPTASVLMVGDELMVSMVIGLAASTALLLPISTPPNAIAFSTGHLVQSDFRFGGIILGVLGPIMTVILVILISSSL